MLDNQDNLKVKEELAVKLHLMQILLAAAILNFLAAGAAGPELAAAPSPTRPPRPPAADARGRA